MNHKKFNELVDELEEISINTLKTKNSKYAPENDALHNFHVGAEIMGVTVQQCIWGYATKHIVALRDKIMRNDWEDKEDALEKIQDIQNYLTFIWCSIHENENKEPIEDFYDDDIEEEEMCCNCKFDYLGNEEEHWDKAMSKVIIEPCNSCKHNIPFSSKEYKDATSNFIRKDN